MGKPQERESSYLSRGTAAVSDRHLLSPLCCVEILGAYLQSLNNLDRQGLPFISFRHSINPSDYKVSTLYLFIYFLWAIVHIGIIAQNLELKILKVCICTLYIGNRSRTHKRQYTENISKKNNVSKRDKWILKTYYAFSTMKVRGSVWSHVY